MKTNKLSGYFTYSLLVSWGFFTLFPLVYMLYSSFLSPDDIRVSSISFFSNITKLTTINYSELFKNSRMMAWFVNSAVICLAVTVLQMLINGMAGYALAKKRFIMREGIFWTFIAVMMIPSQIVCVPLFILVCDLKLIDTLWAVILPSLVSPFGIFMVKQYMEALPDDVLDAARIDGCSEFGLFFKIVVPMSMPVFATLGTFVFIATWNAFLWPLLVLFSEDRYTLSVGLATLQGQHIIDYGLLMAGATISAVPIFFMFAFFSKYIIKGATEGAVKG